MTRRNLLALVFSFCMAFAAILPGNASAATIPAALPGSHVSLLPWLDYHIDESGTDVEEIAANELQLPFARFDPMQPIRSSGTFWLRFTLAPREAGQKAETWMLDMGESIPGKPVLYQPTINPLSGAREWQEVRGGDRHVFLLPEAGLEPLTCYIRLSGAPGIWFSPMLRTPHDAANNWKTMGRYAVLVALCAVMLFCLLRGGGGQWRVWTGLFAAAALAQGLMGLPAAENGRMGFQDLPVVLLPGLALMLLPHAGRHLMHSEAHSRSVDYQLLALTLVGAAVALVPLFPGMAWLSRYLDLWPLATACFLVTALVAVFLRLKGSGRFLLACFLPPAATLAGIMAATIGVDPEIAGACPMLGVTLSTLVLATSKSAIISAEDLENVTISLEQPLDDPNLRIVQAGAQAAGAKGGEGAPQGDGDGKAGRLLANNQHLLLEDALRLPLDRLMREGAALGRCSLPPAVRQYSENMLEQARHIADIISHPTHQPEDKATPADKGQDTPFNLQQLMREAHDAVAPLAESANIGLAWYMPPHLGQMYKGSGQALQETLCMLLESSVRATMHGAVHFSVRRVPESADAGHLLFTITDTGSGMPPRDRSSLALSRAWELAGAHKGYLGVESSPRGATIAFTLHLECLDQEEAESFMRRKPLVLICAESAVDRQSLGHMLSGLQCRTVSARTMNEALQLHKGASAVLFIAQGNIALKAEIRHIQQIQEQSAEVGMPQCHILAITPDDSRWKVLKQLGFTHALAEPVAEADLRHTVQEILDKYTAWQESQQQQAAEQAAGQADGFAPVASTQNDDADGSAKDGAASGEDASPAPLPANPLPGQPLLPNLLHSTGNSQQSPMQIPDLTALPDLLHFAESMGQSTPRQPAAAEPDTKPLDIPDFPDLGAPESLLPPLGDAADGAETAEPAGMPALDADANSDFMAAGGFGGPDWSSLPDDPGPHTRGFTPPDDEIDEVLRADGSDGVVLGEPQPVTPAAEETTTAGDSLLGESFEPLSLGNEPEAPVAAPEVQAPQEIKTAFDTFGEWVGEPTPYTPKAEPDTGSESGAESVPQAAPEAQPAPAAEPVSAPAAAPAAAPAPAVASDAKPAEPKAKPVTKISLRPVKRADAEAPKKADKAQAADKTQAADKAAPATQARATIRLRPAVRPKIELKPVPKQTASPAPEAAKQEAMAPAQPNKEQPPVEPSTPAVSKAKAAAPVRVAPETAKAEPTHTDEQEKQAGNDNFMDFFADMGPAAADAPVESSQGGLPASEVQALLERLDTALLDTKKAFERKDCTAVAEAAGRIVHDCGTYGLHVLGGIAGCVERAAQAKDLGALHDLLPDLYGSIERNRISFSQTM